jgi:Family of unknown function (DUF6364)
MTTKLTLTIEQSTIRKAKLFAEKSGKSLSALVQTYLDSVSKNENSVEQLDELNPDLRKLFGAVSLPKNADEKKIIHQRILAKHQ